MRRTKLFQECPECADREGKMSSKNVNMVTSMNIDGYDNLPIAFSAFQ